MERIDDDKRFGEGHGERIIVSCLRHACPENGVFVVCDWFHYLLDIVVVDSLAPALSRLDCGLEL
jgi:hypothetical protein